MQIHTGRRLQVIHAREPSYPFSLKLKFASSSSLPEIDKLGLELTDVLLASYYFSWLLTDVILRQLPGSQTIPMQTQMRCDRGLCSKCCLERSSKPVEKTNKGTLDQARREGSYHTILSEPEECGQVRAAIKRCI